MPELPEVEIIKRGLNQKIVGKTIKVVKINTPKIFLGDSSELIGRKISAVSRRGKIIIFLLDDSTRIIIHLKMTGQLIFDPNGRRKNLEKRVAGGHPSSDWVGELPNKHTHAIFCFSDDSILYFNDLRKFGYIKHYKKKLVPELENLGIDAMSKTFSGGYLKKKAEGKTIEIKKFIMNQEVIAGIGNIYSDEALFCAGISPKRRVDNISDKEFKKLCFCIKKVLKKGIRFGGSSYRNYVNSFGDKGSMQEHFKVYDREGEKCFGCNERIIRTKIGGRSSYFCPSCQK